jgi:Glycoside Hydrolase Family 113
VINKPAPAFKMYAHRRLARRNLASLALILSLVVSGCSVDWRNISPGISDLLPQPQASPTATEEVTATPVPLETPPMAEIQFNVTVPDNTPPDTSVYLTILDEVTGLALNTQAFPMDEDSNGTEPGRNFTLTLPFQLGSVVKYRYERQAGGVTVAEHTSDGRAVRYRLYHVESPGEVKDVISRWTDTSFDTPTGRIQGVATDADSGNPIPGLLIEAGGQQTLSASDGSFLLEGLPPGIHTLVAFAMDGKYRTFQQGAQVAAQSTTPAAISLHAAPLVSVVFVAKLPGNTPPVIPVRLAGSLYQTGNTFATLSGGISTIAGNMPVLSPLPDGRYSVTLQLPAGADLRYKYTLGDGFWNAEHSPDGQFRLRQIVIPDKNTLVEDSVDSWSSGNQPPVTFDVSVPQNTPATDFVSIQFNPLFGWTEPIPMWHLGDQRWAYVLYSPLNLPGDLGYRYCRDGQCGNADDAATSGADNAGKQVKLGSQAVSIKESVQAWANWGASIQPTSTYTADVTARGQNFLAGVEFDASYHPSWRGLLPQTLQDVQTMGANWVIFRPTWTFTRNSPPVLEPMTGEDPSWLDLVDEVQQAQKAGLQVSINPTPRFYTQNINQWWLSAPRDFGWWLVWFEQYRTFALTAADLAASTQSPALILGGGWMAPALPNGRLADGSPSGIPADATQRWLDILNQVRARYSGKIYWALPSTWIQNPPDFINAIDGIYLLWQPPDLNGQEPTQDNLEKAAAEQLDFAVRPIQLLYNQSMILGAYYPSGTDLQSQVDQYTALLNVVNQRSWIEGFVTRGYYPPTVLQDESASVHGKPAGQVLAYWFDKLRTVPAP